MSVSGLTSPRPPNGGPNSTEASGANCEIGGQSTFKDSVIYLSPNTTNTIVVTWTQRASTGDRYILRLTNIAKNATTDFTLLKSANLSNYTERYDKFQITLGAVETGSYRYEVYDTSSTVAAAVAVVETGLAYVQVVSLTFNTFANSIQYTVFGSSDEGVFDQTFDPSFA
jgi:hypothetical protein